VARFYCLVRLVLDPSVIMRGHTLLQNIRRGHYELGVDARLHRRVAAAFAELAQTI
jgi:transposase, IS6 family